MEQGERRIRFGLLVSVAALLLAIGAGMTATANAKTRKKKAKSKKPAATSVRVYTCNPEADKRPAGAIVLKKDPLNSGAWMIDGLDPTAAPRITMWACKKRFIEPSGQLRPYWRNKQQPPLPPPEKYDVCEPIAVKEIARDRAWFPCAHSEAIHMRID